MAIEIVDFPIQNGGSFHSKMLVHQRVPQEKSDSSGSSGLLASIFVWSPVMVNFFGWFPLAFEPLEASLKIDDPTIKIIADYEPCVAVLGVLLGWTPKEWRVESDRMNWHKKIKVSKMAIYSWFTHETWWFSIVMLVYQRARFAMITWNDLNTS